MLHNERAHGQVGHEMAIHHIDVDPIRAGIFAGSDLIP
jgi:hypothetical protein